MKLILIAPSGGGKGSLADLIVKDYNIPNISTGDILREHRKNGTELGKIADKYINDGILVPDNVMIDIIKDRIAKKDCNNGYILDGFPRTLNQAVALTDAGIKIDSVVELDVAENLIVERLAGRWTCEGKECGFIWNERFEGFTADSCATCKSPIFQREDDKPEAIRKRLANYSNNSRAILDYYKDQGTLFSVTVTPDFMPKDTYKVVDKHFTKLGFKKK